MIGAGWLQGIVKTFFFARNDLILSSFFNGYIVSYLKFSHPFNTQTNHYGWALPLRPRLWKMSALCSSNFSMTKPQKKMNSFELLTKQCTYSISLPLRRTFSSIIIKIRLEKYRIIYFAPLPLLQHMTLRLKKAF